MSTETPPSADGTCLGCASLVTLRPDGKLVEHDSDDNFQLCRGSGLWPAVGDGYDAVRTLALQQLWAAQEAEAAHRMQIANNMNPHSDAGQCWQPQRLIGFEAESVARRAAALDCWRDLAGHGQWWTTACYAIRVLARQDSGDHRSSSTLDRAMAELRVAGVCDWLSTNRGRLLRAIDGMDPDVARATLSDLLFSL